MLAATMTISNATLRARIAADPRWEIRMVQQLCACGAAFWSTLS
jgi:hypothetical protein